MKYFFQKLTPFSQRINAIDDPYCYTDSFLWRYTCISSTQPNRLICANRAYIHLENCHLWKYLLQTLFNSALETIFSMLLLLTEMVVFGEMRVFLQISWIGLFGRKWPFRHGENYDFQEVFLSKSNSVIRGKNGLDAPASNTDGCLWRDPCVSSSLVNRPFGTKRAYQHLEKHTLQEVFLSKTISTLTGKQCARCSCFQHRWFSFQQYKCFLKLAE
jgi:hypothetical protein